MSTEFVIAGVMLGLLLGGLLLLQAFVKRSRLAAATATLLLLAASIAGLIAASWQTPMQPRWAEQVEALFTIASGAGTLVVVAHLVRITVSNWLIAIGALGSFALIVGVEDQLGGDAVVYAVPVQVVFTLFGWLVFRTGLPSIRERRILANRQYRLARWILIAASTANLASVTRLMVPEVVALRPLVPITISALFLALAGIVFWLFLTKLGFATLTSAASSGGGDTDLVKRATASIRQRQFFRNPAFDASDLAASLEVSSTRLAAALAASDYASFAVLVRHLRVEQARLLLADPAEGATSIEAIGLLCGFRSRSAFYEVFRRHVGMTPGEYRQRTPFLS